MERRDGPSIGGQAAKEMVAHVAFWEETVVEEVRILRSEPVGEWYG